MREAILGLCESKLQLQYDQKKDEHTARNSSSPVARFVDGKEIGRDDAREISPLD